MYRLVVLLDNTQTADMLDMATGQVKYTLIGHTAPILRSTFSPDGRWLATTSADQAVRLWDAQNGQMKRVWSVGSALESLDFSTDSADLAVNMQTVEC